MIESAAVRYFREVTECGSIKQAAASLRIAPSAISRQVQAIEEELSVKLFERGARGMVLTDAGHLLYRYAVENRSQLDGIRAKVQEFDTLRRGQVKIATVEGMLASFLSNFVVDLSGDYPGHLDFHHRGGLAGRRRDGRTSTMSISAWCSAVRHGVT